MINPFHELIVNSIVKYILGIICVIVLVLTLLFGAGFYYFNDNKSDKDCEVTETLKEESQ